MDSFPANGDTSKPVVNQWHCVLDGKTYNGIIDTSFFQMVFGYQAADSVIVGTGISEDKKAHIHFKFNLNRTRFPGVGANNGVNTYLVFDTAANNLFLGSVSSATPVVNYKIDTLTGSHFAVSFSGNLSDQKGQIHSISGSFSCSLNTGAREPDKFYCLLDSVKRFGYITSATLNAHALVMEGVDYLDYPLNEYRIVVRTGGTIKPGIYKSVNGDVAFNSVLSGALGDYFYVDDSIGAMTVTILSVTGNIVQGSFSGVNKSGKKIEAGGFVCRVANYVPQPDAANRWAFDAWINPSFGVFNCYAGNVVSAVRTTVGGKYYLTVKGESDHGASAFKIVISSDQPITRGPYLLHGAPGNILDTLYFKSGIPTWDGTIPYLYAGQNTASLGDETYCYIDSIDSNQVSGIFYGIIWNNLEDIHFGSSGPRYIRKASFRAGF